MPLHVEADSLPREADRLLLARFAPACVLVNQALTILQFRGQTGPYLEPAGGPPSFDLRRVIRPELLVQILPAIAETSKTGVASRRDARLDEREIGIEVIPLAGSSGGQSFLILFDDGSRPAVDRSVPAAASALTESDKDRRLAQLEREVEGLRDYMRAAIEEHGAVQEELRSAHEEMLSANEEFQSTNEELETSKEELQSTNEELTTTIDELRSRNEELAALNAGAGRRAPRLRFRAFLCGHHHRDGTRAVGGARWSAANTEGQFGILGESGSPPSRRLKAASSTKWAMAGGTFRNCTSDCAQS